MGHKGDAPTGKQRGLCGRTNYRKKSANLREKEGGE